MGEYHIIFAICPDWLVSRPRQKTCLLDADCCCFQVIANTHIKCWAYYENAGSDRPNDQQKKKSPQNVGNLKRIT